jgi:hypothetical protein
MNYHPGVLDGVNSTDDIEDLDKQISFQDKKISNTPLIIELSIFEGDDFISDENIKKNIVAAQTQAMKKDKNVKINNSNVFKFLLKISGNLAKDIKKLNEKLKFILSVFLKNPILLELTFERLAEISLLDDTILFNRRIHPSVK